jgi:hypothetical protein
VSFPVEIRKKQDYRTGGESPRYFLEVDLDQVAPGRQASIPVHWRSNHSHPVLKEIYTTELGGFRIERGNLPSLVESVKTAVTGMMEDGTLPYYSVSLPNGGHIPIFLIKDKLQARVGKTKIDGKNITEVYSGLKEALKKNGIIRNGFKLEVDIFLWQDLRLYPPAFVLKDLRERTWLPIFCTIREGRAMLNYDEVNRPSELMDIYNVLNVREQMAYRIASYGGVRSQDQIFMDQTHDGVWKVIKEQVERTDQVLSYEREERLIEIPIFEAKRGLIAADRPRVFFGGDISSLASVVAEVLMNDGSLPSTISLRVETKRR